MEPKSARPSSEALFRAMARQGLKEFAQVLPAFKDSIQIVEEPGTAANPTPQEVYKQAHEGKDKAPEMEMD